MTFVPEIDPNGKLFIEFERKEMKIDRSERIRRMERATDLLPPDHWTFAFISQLKMERMAAEQKADTEAKVEE